MWLKCVQTHSKIMDIMETVENKGPAVADIVIVKGETSEVPDGYTKVSKSLNPGIDGEESLYLAFRVVADSELEEKLPISDLIISHGDTIPGMPPIQRDFD